MSNRAAPVPIERSERLAASALGSSMLSMADIASYVGVTKRCVQAWRAEGILPAPDFVVGRVVRWRLSTIDKWLSSRAAEEGTR